VGGGSASSLFSSQQPFFPAGRLDPPRGSLRKALLRCSSFFLNVVSSLLFCRGSCAAPPLGSPNTPDWHPQPALPMIQEIGGNRPRAPPPLVPHGPTSVIDSLQNGLVGSSTSFFTLGLRPDECRRGGGCSFPPQCMPFFLPPLNLNNNFPQIVHCLWELENMYFHCLHFNKNKLSDEQQSTATANHPPPTATHRHSTATLCHR